MKGIQKIHFVEAKNNATIYYKPYPQHASYNEFIFHEPKNAENSDLGENENSDDSDENTNLLPSSIDNEKLQPGQWVIIIYDNQQFHGVIIDVIDDDYKKKMPNTNKSKRTVQI